MKIVCISDTHSFHRKLEVPDGDVLVFAGDMTFAGEAEVVEDFNTWLGELPHKHKVVIAGNHDFFMERRKLLLTNCTYLEDSGCEVDGLKFWGSPFSPLFGRWAFMLPRGKSILDKWLTIPHDTDVLITHGPPKGLCDKAHPDGESLGCDDLATVVDAQPPKLHVFGHIHGGYGERKYKETHFVNAAVLNEAYRLTNLPITVEL